MAESVPKSSNISTKLRLVRSPVIEERPARDLEASARGKEVACTESGRVDGTPSDGHPVFQRHAESTPIELFYDLFFVANLANFSSIHEIQTTSTLTSYVGFFCILWFTWCLTSMHDIRFASDSVLARVAKGVHLGIMVGLAVSGPKFQTDSHVVELRVMALILMVSRFTLSAQYFLVMFHVRKYKNTALPLGVIAGFSLAAAFIYLGISFAFESSQHAYRAFYVIAVAEMVVNITVASQWTVVSFKGTHLTERMSLLTLYILGEGVIDVLKSVGKISQHQDYWSSGSVGVLISAITAIYFFYMIYFDTLNRKHFGAFRQQLWSFLHFPFHTALVLSLAGMAQFVIWQKIMEGFSDFINSLSHLLEPFQHSTDNAEDTVKEVIASVETVLNETFAAYPPNDPLEVSENIEPLTKELEKQLLLFATGQSKNTTELLNIANTIGYQVQTSIMTTYGFEGPKDAPTETSGDKLFDELQGQVNTAALIFQYFFIATGVAIVIMGILSVINVRTHTAGSWIRLVIHLLVGSALCLLCLLIVPDNGSQANQFAASAWPLPMVTIIVLSLLLSRHFGHRSNGSAIIRKSGKLFTRNVWRPSKSAPV